MATIQDTLSAGRTGSAVASALSASASSADKIQNRFLTLLVTQLKNQDPLKPMDNAQITSQLSQISTVNGIDKLNTTVTALSDALMSGQSINATSMIGRQAMAPGSTLSLSGGRAAGAVELADSAERVTLSISGASGNLVRRIELGARPAGQAVFEWDGRNEAGAVAADGSYTYSVSAVNQGKAVGATRFTIGTVTGIGVAGADPTVSLKGVGEVKLDDIRRIQQ
jgi:flagellar basal-body rod modification protein FlgD